jgi:hypothetical protein
MLIFSFELGPPHADDVYGARVIFDTSVTLMLRAKDKYAVASFGGF